MKKSLWKISLSVFLVGSVSFYLAPPVLADSSVSQQQQLASTLQQLINLLSVELQQLEQQLAAQQPVVASPGAIINNSPAQMTSTQQSSQPFQATSNSVPTSQNPTSTNKGFTVIASPIGGGKTTTGYCVSYNIILKSSDGSEVLPGKQVEIIGASPYANDGTYRSNSNGMIPAFDMCSNRLFTSEDVSPCGGEASVPVTIRDETETYTLNIPRPPNLTSRPTGGNFTSRPGGVLPFACP